MNYIRAFTYVFYEKKWAGKIAVGAILLVLCITVFPIPFVLGYIAETMRVAARRQNYVLPDWKDWAGLYKTGLVALIISIAYGIVFNIAGMGMKYIPFIGSYDWILSIIFSVLIPIPILFYVTQNSFKSAFDFDGISKFIMKNYLELILIGVIGFFILTPIMLSGFLVLLIGVFITSFYSFLVRAYFYGELFRVSKNK
jgi:hypothetical protein